MVKGLSDESIEILRPYAAQYYAIRGRGGTAEQKQAKKESRKAIIEEVVKKIKGIEEGSDRILFEVPLDPS